MTIKIAVAEDADMHRVFEICALAFKRNEPFFDLTYPEHWTESGCRIGGERMRKTKNSDPNTVFLKGYENTTGEIVGMAKWNIFRSDRPPNPDAVEGKYKDYYHDEEKIAFVDKLISIFLENRNAAMKRTGGNMLSLDILAIDPKHQRKNVGGALVKWGTDKADELGVETVVESSVYGKGLYVKNGFVFQKGVEMRMPEEFKDDETYRFAWLVRPMTQK